MEQTFFIAVVWTALVFLLFLVMRRLVWWYWGVDQMIKHLASIDESLKHLPAVRQGRAVR